MDPLVSVIIPVYNQQKQLLRALDSLEKQTYKNLEVIVVDDGSSLPVKSLPSSLAGRQSSVFSLQLFRQENSGAPAARNKGFALSKGDYVIFWDADVVALDVDMIQKMLAALQSNPEAGYAYSDFYFGKKKMPAGAFDAERLKRMNYITTTSLIRRSVFPGFDESLKKFQDWDLWLTLLERGISGVYVPGYLFRAEPGGTMSTWLPAFAYRAPWKWLPGIRHLVRAYDDGLRIIRKKHRLF